VDPASGCWCFAHVQGVVMAARYARKLSAAFIMQRWRTSMLYNLEVFEHPSNAYVAGSY
jgi:hypothetical protein